MKRFLSIGFLFVSSFAFSAVSQWGAWGLLNDFEGEVAYIVQAESSWTQQGVQEYLSENGLVKPTDSLVYGKAEITTESGFSFVQSGTWELAPSDSNGTYFVILVSEGKFAVSVVQTWQNPDSSSNPDFYLYDGETYQPIEENWLRGTWSQVPEPTALALLALGVAGLALRRRM